MLKTVYKMYRFVGNLDFLSDFCKIIFKKYFKFNWNKILSYYFKTQNHFNYFLIIELLLFTLSEIVSILKYFIKYILRNWCSTHDGRILIFIIGCGWCYGDFYFVLFHSCFTALLNTMNKSRTWMKCDVCLGLKIK